MKKINVHYANLTKSQQNSALNSIRRPRKKTRKEKYLKKFSREMINTYTPGNSNYSNF